MVMRVAILAIRLGPRVQQALQRPADRRHRYPRRLLTFFPRRRRGLLLSELLRHEEPVRQHHQAGVVMETAPRPALEMIQPEFFLHLLIALFHRPTALPQPDRREP